MREVAVKTVVLNISDTVTLITVQIIIEITGVTAKIMVSGREITICEISDSIDVEKEIFDEYENNDLLIKAFQF